MGDDDKPLFESVGSRAPGIDVQGVAERVAELLGEARSELKKLGHHDELLVLPEEFDFADLIHSAAWSIGRSAGVRTDLSWDGFRAKLVSMEWVGAAIYAPQDMADVWGTIRVAARITLHHVRHYYGDDRGMERLDAIVKEWVAGGSAKDFHSECERGWE